MVTKLERVAMYLKNNYNRSWVDAVAPLKKYDMMVKELRIRVNSEPDVPIEYRRVNGKLEVRYCGVPSKIY